MPLYLNWASCTFLEIIRNTPCLRYCSEEKSFLMLLQASCEHSLLVMSSASAVTYRICGDTSGAPVSRISHGAGCHTDNVPRVSASSGSLEKEPTDLLSIDSGP